MAKKTIPYIQQLPGDPMLAEVKIAYKTTLKACDRPQIMSSIDLYQYLNKIWDHDSIEHCEHFLIVMLDRQNRVLGWKKISIGGTSATIVDPKIIFQTCLLYNACSVILAHNHPSGNTKPSRSDIEITKKLKSVGQSLDLPVLDHLIITSSGFLSFSDEGLLD